MPPAFKRVPAIDKCFAILELLAKVKKPLGISDISGKLELNKSTVFNIVYTLMDLNVLENQPDSKFRLGTRFYILGNMAGKRSDLIQIAHPYLEMINEQTKLSAFLGLRSDRQVILIDKVDSAHGIKVSSEIGMQMPALAGAGPASGLRSGMAHARVSSNTRVEKIAIINELPTSRTLRDIGFDLLR